MEEAISLGLSPPLALHNSDFEGAHGGFALLRDENHRHGACTCTNAPHSAANKLAIFRAARN